MLLLLLVYLPTSPEPNAAFVAYLPTYLANVSFFFLINLPAYIPTSSSNLSILFFELLFYLLTQLTMYILLIYVPTFLLTIMFTYLPMLFTYQIIKLLI
jgi:hypothetical protein